jgi:hypothetical protein
VAPDLRRPEDVIAEAVIGVAVGVDHDPDGEGSDRREVRDDLGCLSVADPRVDEKGARIAEHDPDILIVEGVSPDIDAVADFRPI